jgi:hypothetical protein
VADDQVGCQPRHFAHQGVAPDRTKHVNPGRAQVGGQVDGPDAVPSTTSALVTKAPLPAGAS